MNITYIGHATLLVEINGVRILTDPNFDENLARVLRRVSTPGIAIDRLPKLDALLVTHAHFDHLSFRSLDQLSRDIPLFAPKAIAKWLVRKGYNHARALEPGEVANIDHSRLRIHAEQARHDGSRYALDRWRRAANMYLIESSTESVFFAGDTALTRTSHKIVENVIWSSNRRLDVAMLPIGYAPAWKPGFRRGHLTSQDALELFEILRARALIPYHWGTFRHLTASPYDAINKFREVLAGYAFAENVHILEPGQVFASLSANNVWL